MNKETKPTVVAECCNKRECSMLLSDGSKRPMTWVELAEHDCKAEALGYRS